MAILNTIASNWSRVEREKLNNNWTIIERYLSNLQGQINLLTGDVDVQALIDQINEILNQGNVVIADLESALQDATTVITNAENATTDANNATTEANDAAQSALNAVNDIQNIIDNFGVKGIYDSDTIYSKNNSVYHEGSSYIYTNITPSKGNPPPNYPTVSNTHWQMTAAKGARGDGAVSKVNGKVPNGEGEIVLTPTDIGAASASEFAELLSGGTIYNATLLNGLTGSLKYRKDLSGLVNLKVSIRSNNTFPELTSIANLPEGYRPLYRIVIPILNIFSGTVAHLYITDDGAIVLAKGYSLTQNQDYQCEIVFKGVVV